jgi:hypothetical protein
MCGQCTRAPPPAMMPIAHKQRSVGNHRRQTNGALIHLAVSLTGRGDAVTDLTCANDRPSFGRSEDAEGTVSMSEWSCARRSMRHWGGAALAMGALLFSSGPWSEAHSFPVTDDRTGLPINSELDEDAIDIPREVFHSEALHGRKSYFSNLGNLAFNSPYILGGAARKARISCGTCHVNGASNPKLFIPGLSTRPGNFDTTSAFFNPKTDNGVLDPVTIPSLRGARFMAPYGHDGRTASLRDFVLNVIVNEFSGPVPSPQILDAIMAYIEDIDFLPNPGLDEMKKPPR